MQTRANGSTSLEIVMHDQITTSRTAVITAAEWPHFCEMTPLDQENYLDDKWEEHAASQGKQLGETWPMVPFNPNHNHRMGFCDPNYGCADDSFAALVNQCGITIGPEADDDLPEAWEIAENAGPAMVTICHDTSSDTEQGNAGRVECWDVVATANSPQWSEVA